MSPPTSSGPSLPEPTLWSESARAHLAELLASDDRPRRTLITGPAGSGKSSLLRHLGRALAERGVEVVVVRNRADIESASANCTLLVDDANLLDPTALAALASALEAADASVVVASRPWPSSPELVEIERRLESSAPSLVLGHLTRKDLSTIVDGRNGAVGPECVEIILETTGGIAWLVIESLSIHDATACERGPDHRSIDAALHNLIAHRLAMLEEESREGIESLALRFPAQESESAHANAAEAGYAAGLLARNGQPVPIVRAAVQATTPVSHLVRLFLAESSRGGAPDLGRLVPGVVDPRLSDALIREGDTALDADPGRAARLYHAAIESGAPPASLAVRRARAAWASGDVDEAAVLLDASTIDADDPAHEEATDIAASIWAVRGMLEMSHSVYRASPPRGVRASHAVVAAFGVGDRAAVLAADATTDGLALPSTRSVALELLVRGLRASIARPPAAGLNDFVRASEMYSASGDHGPVPEFPAVIAAIAALSSGDPRIAATVLDDSLRDDQGGRWARQRLLLWRAWVAVQLGRPQEAEAGLEAARDVGRRLAARDRVLADSVRLALARRYSDASGLESTWNRSRETLLTARFDAFSLLPLGEFAVTGARLGDTAPTRDHFRRALAMAESLGSPFWAAPLHWAGIQQGILRDRPDDLKPHAHALVAAAPFNTLADTLARAGRVWTSVLTGAVDPPAVEEAVRGLGEVGMTWDGARLAGQAAARVADRKVVSRLLASARHLQPREECLPEPEGSEGAAEPAPAPRTGVVLSAREREVGLLVVQGKTYAEIGEAIFISPRTAEHHIARIRQRLGATTRSDLISKLRAALDDVDP